MTRDLIREYAQKHGDSVGFFYSRINTQLCAISKRIKTVIAQSPSRLFAMGDMFIALDAHAALLEVLLRIISLKLYDRHPFMSCKLIPNHVSLLEGSCRSDRWLFGEIWPHRVNTKVDDRLDPFNGPEL